MDPNEALRRIRELHEQAGSATISNEHSAQLMEEAAELFAGLDDWLTKGGFLPDVWGEGLRG